MAAVAAVPRGPGRDPAADHIENGGGAVGVAAGANCGPENRGGIKPHRGPVHAPRNPAWRHDSQVKAVELRLVGLYRDSADADMVYRCLDDADAGVRAAAADALGLIHCPAYTIHQPAFFFEFQAHRPSSRAIRRSTSVR